MASHVLKTFSLQLDEHTENSATLRTDIAPNIGTAKGPGFSVDFKVVHEVHGGFDPPETDNASLIVIRIVPFPKDIDRQFVWFKVQFSVLPIAKSRNGGHSTSKHGVGGNYDDDGDDEENIPQFRSFEPASKGEQFIDVYTTNESRERMAQLSGQVPIAQAATVGAQVTSTNKSEFQRTHLLKVKAREGRNDRNLSRNVYNQATWTIHAANKDQGIGDSFTVAMLIKRPRGSKFQLAAEVDGKIGSFSASAGRFLSSGVLGKKPLTCLSTFPVDSSNERVPPGVLVEDLHRASTDNVMRDIEDIGLHLPEKAAPITFNPVAVAATSLGLDSEPTPNDEQRGATTTGSAEVPSLATPPVPNTLADHAPATSASHRNAPVAPSPAVASPDTIVVDLLTGISQQLQQLTAGLQQTHGQSTGSNRGSMARFGRHREIAALYERLAELHREEAKEYLQLGERDVAAKVAND